MQRTATAIVLICASALGGCAGGYGSRAPANHAFLDMYDRPPSEKRNARPAVSQSKPVAMATVGSASAAPAEYSPEWWAAEREREKRENERLKRVMQICQC